MDRAVDYLQEITMEIMKSMEITFFGEKILPCQRVASASENTRWIVTRTLYLV